jgi:hypothetical protein
MFYKGRISILPTVGYIKLDKMIKLRRTRRKEMRRRARSRRKGLYKLNLSIIRLNMIQAGYMKRGFKHSFTLYKLIKKKLINEKEKKGMV